MITDCKAAACPTGIEGCDLGSKTLQEKKQPPSRSVSLFLSLRSQDIPDPGFRFITKTSCCKDAIRYRIGLDVEHLSIQHNLFFLLFPHHLLHRKAYCDQLFCIHPESCGKLELALHYLECTLKQERHC